MRRRGYVGLLSLLVACATPGPEPEPVLDAFKAAVARGDLNAALALSDLPPERKAALGVAMADPGWLQGAEARLAGPLAVRRYAEVNTPRGERLRLAQTPEGWRIVDLDLLLEDTPERALATFFAAFEAHDWPALRPLIPTAAGEALAEESQLAAHLLALVERVRRAQAALQSGPRSPAVITGDRAHLDYGPGRSVRFQRENGRWRILDLE
jgi:hypothetical protein